MVMILKTIWIKYKPAIEGYSNYVKFKKILIPLREHLKKCRITVGIWYADFLNNIDCL